MPELTHRELGRLILLGAGALGLVGLLTWTGALSWFGRLPGDIRYESENTRVFIPLTSMLILSVLLSLAMHLWRKL